MNNDNVKPQASQSSAGDGPSEAATRELLDGFLQGIKRGDPQEESFHQVMEALFAVGERLGALADIDPALTDVLQRLRRLTLAETLPPETTKGKKRLAGKRLVGTVPLDRIEHWLDTIRHTLNHFFDGDAPHRSLIAYSQYIAERGPGANMGWFIRLAIRAALDEKSHPAHEAEALACVGAAEALPALRMAAQRYHGDPHGDPRTERVFDAAIKKPINEAIARLESKTKG
jgi:hypothetical protein